MAVYVYGSTNIHYREVQIEIGIVQTETDRVRIRLRAMVPLHSYVTECTLRLTGAKRRLGVGETKRGSGMATVLLCQMMKIAQKRGVAKMLAYVRRDNQAMLHIFEN